MQWTDGFAARLARADIGIAPNELPLRDRALALESTAYTDGELAYEPFDHLVRFKASTNPGRLYAFAVAGLPVVSDFVPSAAQFLLDGESGLLACSPHGWFEALESLAASAELRTRLAAALRERLESARARQADVSWRRARATRCRPRSRSRARRAPRRSWRDSPASPDRRAARAWRRRLRATAAVVLRVYMNFRGRPRALRRGQCVPAEPARRARAARIRVTHRPRARYDVALLNALTLDIDRSFVERVAERAPVVHRKTGYRDRGPAELRAEVDSVVVGDRLQVEFDELVTHSVFQSEYSRIVFEAAGFAGRRRSSRTA